MVVSVLSSTPLEEVAAAAGQDAVLWAQLDICMDRSLTVQDALRAQRCGCAAIVVTLDPPSLVAEEAGEDFEFLSKPTAEMYVFPKALHAARHGKVNTRGGREAEWN